MWGSLEEFLAMGGYGLYVWGAYGVTALLLGVELFLVLRRSRALERGAARHGEGGQDR